ncbi:MAG: hypothetical protein ABW007_03835 [Chitinophagaceae bacterium]
MSAYQSDFVFEEFRKKIEEKHMSIAAIDPDGLIHVRRGEEELKVTLDNLRRNFEHSKDKNLIADFVELIAGTSVISRGTWEQVKEHIYTSLLPLKSLVGDPIYQPVTMIFGKVYVYKGEDKLTWIDYSELERWNVTQEQLARQAAKNADRLLEQASIKVEMFGGKKLGLIDLAFASLKTALLFAPSFREKIEPEFGFPFYAVMPVRDGCYIFSEEDFEFFTSRIGTVIVDEYKKSNYPLTTEVLKFDEDGVDAVGEYPAD